MTIRKLEEAIYEDYYNIQMSVRHGDVAHEYKKYYPYLRANYLKYLPQNKDAKVVDLACGLGQFLFFLKESGYTNILGVDNSKACVDICNANQMNVDHSDLFVWLKNHKCDAIIANDVLEHLDRDQLDQFFFLAHSALNPGGVLITKVPNAANPITGSAARYIDYTHKTSFTELSLKAVLQVYFKKNHICGQNLFVYYKNPLNYIGIIGQLFFDKFFYLLSCLYGQPELKIFKKSLISASYKD